jgi:serine/threonine-protein kinase
MPPLARAGDRVRIPLARDRADVSLSCSFLTFAPACDASGTMTTVDPALKETLGYSDMPPLRASALTPRSNAGATDEPVHASRIATTDVDDTLPAPASSSAAAKPAHAGGVTVARGTVLPRRQRGSEGVVVEDARPRFQKLRTLGEGGMGQVELARDNDIRRTVAVKRLRDDAQSNEAVLRFADEVRIVGQLEHPAIVPVYDVGRDETGSVYLVMKHLDGETMEQVIEKLGAGDAEALAKYTLEYRVHLFLAVLDAIRYAHARGVIHRDIKPANIMIGPYGEVTVLDWGIAKPIHRTTDEGHRVEPVARTLASSNDKRLLETALGALAGTPLYMSPEQARGANDELDERSDIYTLCIVLYEWLSLRHPLADKRTVTEVLAETIHGLDIMRIAGEAMKSGTPAEWLQRVMKGMARDPADRFQSVDELETGLRRVLEGRVPVQCHVTLAKRGLAEVSHWIDRHPKLYTAMFLGAIVSFAIALATAVYRIVVVR